MATAAQRVEAPVEKLEVAAYTTSYSPARLEEQLGGWVAEGKLQPDLSRPGHGLELKEADAERYAQG